MNTKPSRFAARSRSGLGVLLSILVLTACGGATAAVEEAKPAPHGPTDTAIFAGGCFWCSESDFEKVPGVVSVISGYTGGDEKNPTYQQVSSGRTGHAEAVEVEFDPAQISYEELLDIFWHSIDPTVKNRQFCDAGTQYRTGIFYRTPEQQQAAEASLEKLNKTKPFAAPIVTELTAFKAFYAAEDYHQDFYKKSADHYHRYRRGCGRDLRLEELWGKAKK
jgi:peptide-methionine (S)-S-oxide reductase